MLARKASILVIPLALFALAACGSSSGKSATTNAGTQPPASANAATVMAAHNAKLGALLVDNNGMTLYTLTKDGHPVACTGQCATFWPPLLLPANVITPMGAHGVTGLGVVSMNGGTQVTEHGAPLHRYSGDNAAGDTNGEGINSFGGIWHVARTTAATPAAATTPNTTASPMTSGNGYGYGG
jgi:predicted lipoprotein with Yx(FWY)xxD motif